MSKVVVSKYEFGNSQVVTDSHTTEPASLVYRFIGLQPILGRMSTQTTPPISAPASLGSPNLTSYSRFKMALKSKEVQRQYPSLLEKFYRIQ